MSEQTILYVEDNEYNRKIVQQLLSRTTYRLIEAMDGESGVAMAQKELPDLILMDVQLPKMSGLDATRVLKADPRTRTHPGHRDHLVRAERRPGEGVGGRRHQLPRETVQPARAAGDGPRSPARTLIDELGGDRR